MERRVGKLMRKFVLPDNANIGAIFVVCKNDVMTVMVDKVPPSNPKKHRTIHVRIA
ncbi:17.2 kDa class II heat shock protein [Linum perenne]